jgi:hypothetical protein
MYCPNCGIEATPGLNYCKRCGGSLTQSQLSVAPEMPRAVSPAGTWAIGMTTLFLVVGGLAVLLGTLIALTNSGLPPRSVVTLAMFGFLTIVASVALLMRFWMRLLTLSPRRTGCYGQMETVAVVNELSHARPVLFPSHVASVTENTTRTFEPVYREPQR